LTQIAPAVQASAEPYRFASAVNDTDALAIESPDVQSEAVRAEVNCGEHARESPLRKRKTFNNLRQL
jgi:hypothetical protein